MIFIIISNIGLALMTLLLYMRYSHFRVTYGNKIKELSASLREEKGQGKTTQNRLETDYKRENEQVKSLLKEVQDSRKERQDEIKLRLEAEKEIEVSKEKIIQVQKRIEDWKMLQEAAINDSKDMIIKFGQDLITMVKKNQEADGGKTREIFVQNAKSIEDNVNNLHTEIGEVDSKMVDFRKRLSNMVKYSAKPSASNPAANSNVEARAAKVSNNSSVKSTENNAKRPNPPKKSQESAEGPTIVKPENVQMGDMAQIAMRDVVSMAQASGLKHMKDYIVASKLDEKKAKYMLCDLFILIDGVAHFVDFKADRYFTDYDKLVATPDEKKGLEILQKRLDKYMAYISNPKYVGLIKKLVAALKIEVNEFKVVFAVKTIDDTTLLDKIGYSKKIEEMGLELMDVNSINDLIL